MADDAQSGTLRYCKVIAPSVVVVRICFRLGVGVGVECASAGMLTVEDNIRGGDEMVEVDEDSATTTGECWECSGKPAAPPQPASVDDGRCPRLPALMEWGERLGWDDKPPRIMPR